MTVLWVASSVTVANGSPLVTVDTAEDVTKIETSATFHGVGFSLPYEIERTYNNGTNDVIVLHENWAGSSGSIAAVSVPSGAAVTRAADSLEALKTVYEALADSVSTTVVANGIPKYSSQGRLKAAPGSASDEVVVKSQTGTAATKDVTTSATDTTSNRILKVGDGGILGNAVSGLPLDTYLPTTIFSSQGSTFTAPAADSFVMGLNIGRRSSIPQAVQIAFNDPLSVGDGMRAYFRGINEVSGYLGKWFEFYHSGNANFNEFGGNGADDRIAFGVSRNTVTAFIHLHINSKSAATGFSATGTFKLVDSTGLTTIATGLTNSDFSLSNVRPSNRLLSLLVTFPAASVVKDTPVYLETESSDAKIEVTF